MANVEAPFGFRQYSGAGSAPTYEQVTALVAYDADPIYFGDAVYPTTAGTIVSSAPTTDPLAGVFVGCQYLSVSQKRTVWSNYWPGSDVASGNYVTAYVVNDPNARFEVQVSGSASVGMTIADIGQNATFGNAGGNAANGISGQYLSYQTDDTVTYPFKVYGLVTNPPGQNGTFAGPYNYVIVGFNNVITKSTGTPT